MPANEDVSGGNAPQQPPPPTPPPSIEGTADSDSGSGKNETGKNQHSKEKSEHWGKSVEAICAMLLVCITGYYAYFAKKQWLEAQRTANAAVCATRISAEALNLGRQEFASSEAAVLQPKVSIRDVGKGAFVQIDIINSGHIAATAVNGEITFSSLAKVRKMLRITNATVTSHSPAPESPSGFITRTIILNEPRNMQILATKKLQVIVELKYWNGIEQVTTRSCSGLTVSPNTGFEDWQDCENQEAFQQQIR